MADSVFGGSLPTLKFAAPPQQKRKRKKEDRGVLGLVGNFAGDVKDALIGIPRGVVEIGGAVGRDYAGVFGGDLDFDRTRKLGGQILGATWQTWKPLAQGDLGKFASQVYDHPLAPLLDVATVFSGGALGAAKGAQALSKAGVRSSAVAKTAALGQPKALTLRDPVPGREGRPHDIDRDRHDLSLHLSERPGRRLVQEFRLRGERYAPQWYVTRKNAARYEREWAKTEGRELSAKNRYEDIALSTIAAIKSGKTLSDPKLATAAYTAMLSTMHANLTYHAPVRRAAAEAAAKLPKDGRYRYVRQLSDEDFEQMLGKVEPETVLKQFGNRAVTRKLADAAVDADGNVALVSKMDARNLGWEAANSSKFVKHLWHNPTMLWKSIMVGWAPRTITNNAVGNWALYAARQGGHHSIMGIYDAIRLTKGERAAKKMLGSVEGFSNWQAHWSNKHFGDELGNTFGAEAFADEPGRISGGKLKRRAKSGIYPIVHATSDRPVRVAALSAYLREAPEVRALTKKGRKFDDAVNEALDGNRALRDRAANHVRTIAGDYATMRPWERRVRDLVPFYLWDRHIVKTTGNLVLDTPGRVALMQRVSQMGVEETEDFLGKIPSFLRGAVPFGDKEGGRANVLLTHSMNPFATVGELAEASQAMMVGRAPRGGQTLLGQINPFLTGMMEAATGRDSLTGAPVESKGGILSSVLYRTAMELPPAQLAKAIKDDTSRGREGKPFLYEKGSAKTVGLSLLGVPTRDMSLERASELYRDEQGLRKTRSQRKKSQFLPELKSPAAF